MAIGEIFDRLKKYLRQIFRAFISFHSKQSKEYKIQKEPEVPLEMGGQKGEGDKYDSNKLERIEGLNEKLEKQTGVGKQDDNSLPQQKELSIEPEKQKGLEEVQPEVEGEPAEGKTSLEESAPLKEIKKPYIKKIPIPSLQPEGEERAQRDYPKKDVPEEEKVIDLAQARERKTHIKSPRSIPDGGIEEIKEKTDEEGISTYDATRIEAPFICLNIDSKAVSIVLPEQRIKADSPEGTFTEQNYRLRVNNEWQDISARAILKEEYFNLKEREICSEKPIKEFEVVFPDGFKRRYKYGHEDSRFYFFIAVGNDRGRLLYSIDRLPRRLLWILLGEKYEIAESNAIRVIEESYIWGKYKPFLVDLRQADILTIKNKETQEEIKFHCEPSFIISGDCLIEDDFKLECPLFRGGNLKIIAPYESQAGWSVWIQNRTAGSKLISKMWTGLEPLTLDCSKDFPCDLGEFQIDLCEHNGGRDETLFFRWIPYIELDYPRELIIPDCKIGHLETLVTLVLERNKKWELKDEAGQEIDSKENGHYELRITPQKERHCFSVSAGQGEFILRLGVTIPRLKWKLSNQEKWHDKTLNIKKTDLLSEKLLDLLICTNDFNKEYKFTSVLEIKGQAQRLQTEKINRKGMFYVMNLNQFYDTIRYYNSNLVLKIEGNNERDGRQLCSFEALHFKIETPESRPKVAIRNLIEAVNAPKLCSFFRKIENNLPKEKRYCKEIRQMYYRKLKKRRKLNKSEENKKIKREFILRSLAFLKFLLDKYGENIRIKNKQKIERWVFSAQENYSEEFKNYCGFYS